MIQNDNNKPYKMKKPLKKLQTGCKRSYKYHCKLKSLSNMCVRSGVTSIKKPKNLACLSSLGGQTAGRSALPSVGSDVLAGGMQVGVTGGGICLWSGRSIFERCESWAGRHQNLICGIAVWPKGLILLLRQVLVRKVCWDQPMLLLCCVQYGIDLNNSRTVRRNSLKPMKKIETLEKNQNLMLEYGRNVI